MPTTMTWPISTGPVGEVAIANMALGLIGANYLTADTLPDSSGTPEANYINQFYAHIREVVLEDRDWTFATKKVAVTAMLNTDPLYPGASPTWGYIYSLPSDCLRVVKPFTASGGLVSSTSDDPEATELPVQYELLNDFLYCNTASGLYLKYIADEDDTTVFSANFVQALAARLAAELALPLTNNVQLFQSMMQKYQMAIKDAAAGDGRQGTSQKIKSSTRLHLARYGRR